MRGEGFQLQIGSGSASLPCLLPRCGGRGVFETQLPFSRADCSLRTRRSVRLQANGNLQFGSLLSKLSKSRVDFRKTGCSAVPRSKLEELSTTAEEIGEKKNSAKVVNESVRGSEGRVSSSEDHETSVTSADQSSSFDWLAHWYPVGVVKHMDKRQPYPVTVLGRDLVVWWDRNSGQWQVFADACPHRLAPLSEGRINEQGHLQCSYHGWAFASSGACTMIPQAPKDVFENRDSKRSCAVTYLSKEHQGMVWVFMDASVGAKERAAGTDPPFIPVLSDPDFVYDMGISDLTYSYESLIENLLDPAHVPFAHHGLQGNRSLARPLDFRVEKIGKEGFRGGMGETRKFTFTAPCLAWMDMNLPPPSPPNGHPWALKFREFIMSKIIGDPVAIRKISTVFFCVPLSPGKSRVFFAFPRNFAKLAFNLSPRWWNHLVHMTVLDSDMYLLHLMERRLEDRGGMPKIEKLYYTPTTSDAFVVSYRKWLGKFGGSVPDYGPKASDRLPASAPKTELLNRYALHVVHCTTCSGAMRKFKTLESVLRVLPFFLIGLVAASNTRPLRSLGGFSIPLICAALICSVASEWLKVWIKKNFEFHDYNHALVK